MGLSCSEYSKIENDIKLGTLFAESMRSVQLSIWNNKSPIAVNSSIFKFRNSNEWIANNSPCPKCTFRIKKNGRCNHGRCGNCSFSFCWICGGDGIECGSYICRNRNVKTFAINTDSHSFNNEAHTIPSRLALLERYASASAMLTPILRDNTYEGPLS